MTGEHVFGSGRLTPDLLRDASFTEDGGRYDATEVRTFLQRAASALDVLMSEDASVALRAEFSRNAEIAQQVLDAGQTASEQLRRQAGEDARRIIEETRVATAGLRESMEHELADSRAQVAALRGQFIGDLRDLYDRIGASLYRFERAAEGDPAIVAIGAPPAHAGVAAAADAERRAGSTTEASPIEFRHDRRTEQASEPSPAPIAEPDLPEGAMPPAWQQLPPDAWNAEPALEVPIEPVHVPQWEPAPDSVTESPVAPAPGTPEHAAPEPEPATPELPPAPLLGGDPFLVVEDEPLAPGEPLVDLRELGSEVPADPALEAALPAVDGGSWLDNASPEAAPRDGGVQPAADGGSWLAEDPAPSVEAAAPVPAEVVQHDNALAEALIGGTPFGEEEPAAAPPHTPESTPAPVGPAAAASAASADALAVRQLILNSLAEGHSREAVEAYLRDHMGLLEPGVLVDAALGASGSVVEPPPFS